MATSKGANPSMDGKEIDQVSRIEFLGPEKDVDIIESAIGSNSDEEAVKVHKKPVETARDLVTSIVSAEDDPTLNPWTFRTWFLGMAKISFPLIQLIMEQDLEWLFSALQPQLSLRLNHSRFIYIWFFLQS
jgi:hypothetical protein